MCRRVTCIALAASLIAALAGCQQQRLTPDEKYRTVSEMPNRDTATARKHNAAAVKLLKDDKPDDAQARLESALAADLLFGPAHNNLGTVYFRQKKYYLAAWEFQYAAKLMPNHAEPRNNLGLVFEAVSRFDDAAKWYDEALALEPESTQIAGNLARVHIRANRADEQTRELLAKIVMKDSRPAWTAWARQQLSLIGQPKSSPLPEGPKKK